MGMKREHTPASGGRQIGRSGDKLSFFGATPVVKPADTGETTGFAGGSGGTAAKDVSTWTGNVGSTAYTVSDIVKALKHLGLLTS